MDARFKLDENLPREAKEVFLGVELDALTVHDEGLGGTGDAKLAAICLEERRALVTLDLDFADIRRYPPPRFAGIVVLRLRRLDRSSVLAACRRIITTLQNESVRRTLWIVEDERIRVRG